MARYTQVEAEKGQWSEWVLPVQKGYKMACCDCGLVHVMDFRVRKDGQIEYRCRRDNRATGQVRRHMKED